MRRLLSVAALLLGAACTEVSTDPNAVVAVQFIGSPYPSIVAGDSLRDSLGALQPLRATGLNYKGDPIEGAGFVFSSPDTVLRVFATAGKLQSVPDSLLVVQRPDSFKATKPADTIFVNNAIGGTSSDASRMIFSVFGDTAGGKPKAPVPGWLVSLQLRHDGETIAPTDTSYAFTFELINSKRIPTYIDTTESSGAASRRVFIRSLSKAEDTVIVVATMRLRTANSAPITDSTIIVVRPSTTTP